MATTTIKVDDAALMKRLKKMADMDFLPANREFAQYMRVQVDSMFRRAGSGEKGGKHRGVAWAGFAPQYTRKDGTVIPAWGGVKRVAKGRVHIGNRLNERRTAFFRVHNRITGKVQGRLRPSGTRITKGSRLMQDTNTLRARAALVIDINQFRGRLGPQGVKYAAKQNAIRPFLFFIQKDANKYSNILRRFLRKESGG